MALRGQSNIQFHVNELSQKEADAKETTTAASGFYRRLALDYIPLDTLSGGQWQVCDSNNIQAFSAVAFFFRAILAGKICRCPLALSAITWVPLPLKRG